MNAGFAWPISKSRTLISAPPFNGTVLPGHYYVNTLGNDSNSGTVLSPWQTVAKVNSVTTFEGGNTIHFQKGQRFEGQLNPSSGGSSGNPLVFDSYGDGPAPVISGGVRITGWTLHDADRGIWKAPFAASVGRPRALWCNGVRCVRPKRIVSPNTVKTSTGLLFENPGGPYTNTADMEVIVRMDWEEQRIPVDAFVGTEATIRPLAFSRMNAFYAQLTSGGAFHGLAESTWAIENAYELLADASSTRTFYHDRTAGQMYLIPPLAVDDPNNAVIIAPVLETVLDLQQDYVRVQNIEFAHTTSLQPSSNDGFVDIQGTALYADVHPNQQLRNWTPSMLVDNCTGSTVTRCIMRRLGSTGIQVETGAVNATIRGNLVEDVSGCGVMNGNPSNDSIGPAGTLISDNIIRDCGIEFRGALAVAHWFGANTIIEHNLIYRHPYTGIGVGIGWGVNMPNLESGTRVRYNRIYDVVQTMMDGGGIYANSQHSDFQIYNNYISRSGRTINHRTCGLYLDDATTGATAFNNVLTEIGGNAYILAKNSFSITGTTSDGGVVANEGTGGSVLEAMNIVSLAAAEAAGEALGAGLSSGYADLAVTYPDNSYGDFRSGLALEIIAANASTSETQVNVTRLIDSAGNNDLTQLTSGSQPLFVPNQLGGKPAIRFASDEVKGKSPCRARDTTIMAIVKLTSSADGAFLGGHGTLPQNGIFLSNTTGKRAALAGYSYAGGTTNVSVGGNQTSAWELWTLTTDLVDPYIHLPLRVNGVSQELDPAYSQLVYPTGYSILNGLGCDVAALRIYDGALSAAQCDRAELRLKQLAGLT